MLEEDNPNTSTTVDVAEAPKRPRRRRAAVREPGPPAPVQSDAPPDEPATDQAETKPVRRRRRAKPVEAEEPDTQLSDPAPVQAVDPAPAEPEPAAEPAAAEPAEPELQPEPARRAARTRPAFAAPAFQAPAFIAAAPVPVPVGDDVLSVAEDIAAEGSAAEGSAAEPAAERAGSDAEPDEDDAGSRRRRRGRRGRGRSKASDGDDAQDDAETAAIPEPAADTPEAAGAQPEADDSANGPTRRRRRRRRRGDGDDTPGDVATSGEPVATVVHVREPRKSSRAGRDEDEVQGVKGSTRLEAKRQRRRDVRDSGRRRPSIISESEFLARRESVERVMVVREGRDRTQIAVLEDDVLVEHYVTRASATSYVGNVYLGRVQNVLPSMEAAFVDIGKGRNAVLYAGEVNYDASQFEGKPHRIEQALKSGDKVLVQVSKDPIGSKGSRLTSQISLPGRYVVYVPEGERTGISRKLPDTERARLKSILKKVSPADAGLIVRTAAEGASEEELGRDMARLEAQWEVIQKKATSANPPALLHAEPDLVIRVIRDVFNEDFTKMIVQAADEWDTIEAYVEHVAPDLHERLEQWTDTGDIFASYRIDEQLAKALDRKVWLPSGGSLVFDRTEAMVVVDVNTGKFTGKGGNLEETVTKNNLEAAEEIARQLRLRDLGGIIVIDFIDMVLEGNRDLVLRRLLECLGRDRTKHQVAEVTSLGLVQMTRKRVGQGLIEAFAQTCPECNGRGVKILIDPFEPATATADVG